MTACTGKKVGFCSLTNASSGSHFTVWFRLLEAICTKHIRDIQTVSDVPGLSWPRMIKNNNSEQKILKKISKESLIIKYKLDVEERKILNAFEKGELKPVRHQAALISRLRTAARNTIKKDKRVNIRISTKDLTELQALAIQDGIPYQTLMSSVLHKYAGGRLRDKKVA
jgi:predicted DNA binding CopG/RHH family protein